MKIVGLTISEFRRLSGRIPWASSVVLFGANDSGKTNVLDAIAASLTGLDPARIDRATRDTDYPSLRVEVELPALDMRGSFDQEVFFEWARSDVAAIVGEHPILSELRTRLERMPSKAGEPEAYVDGVAAFVDEFIAFVRDTLTASAPSEEHANPSQLKDSVSHLLSSRRFRLEFDEVAWLPPAGSEMDDGEGFFPFGVELDLRRLANIVRPSLGDWANVEEAIEGFIARELSQRPESPPGGVHYLSDFEARDLFDGEGWLERKEDWVRVDPAVADVCARLGDAATALSPPFLHHNYRIEVIAHAPDQWRRVGSRVTIGLTPADEVGSKTFDLAVASTGLSTWAAYAVAEAIRRADVERSGARNGPDGAPTVYLIDEPERHLHPLAQEEVARWLAAVAADGGDVVIATHAAPFLRLPIQDVEYVRVVRLADRSTRLQAISTDLLGELRESAASFGLSPAAAIQLTRGWLVVEGEDDRRVVETLYGDELRRAGVTVLRLRGAARAKATFMSLDALAGLRIPFFVLLDNVRADAVRGELPDHEPATEEEAIVRQLVHLKQQDGVRLSVLSFPWPDIICALPIDSVNRVLDAHPKAAGPVSNWIDLVDEFALARRGEEQGNFKAWALSRFGLEGQGTSWLVQQALAEWDGVLPDAHPLRGPVDFVLNEAWELLAPSDDAFLREGNEIS